ncbi:hypothetical protein [Brachyspira pulli]|uniref:hypothetical protein n=1 Tax=Brachyspira pulli TaxID=310721 RepID=UPI003005405C
MKKYKLFFIIYVSFSLLYIITLISLSILGNKIRIGYLGDFNFDENHIIKTLELNDLSHIKQNYIIDGKLDEESIKNFIFTNESITQYSYGCRVKYYSKVFRNSDIYGVYVDTNKIIKDNDFIKEINISYNGSPFGSLISTKIIDFDKIDNVNYKLKIKYKLLHLFIFININLFIIIFIIKSLSYYYNNITFNDYKLNLNKDDYKFIISAGIISLSMFLFQYWLFFPGYFQYWDTLEAMNIGYFGGFHNWRPLITFLFLNFLYKTFGYNTFYLLILNLSFLYLGLYLIVVSLYIKYKNKLFILILLISFLSVIFFNVINLEKDFTASFILFLALSIIFFKININNLKIKILLNIIILPLLIISMLWRHNFIVTVYPIFIYIVYDFLQVTIRNKSLKNYIIKFISYMFIVAILLIIISKQFPLLFLNSSNNKEPTKYIMILHIMGCASVNDDGSLIPNEWYAKGKNFDDAKDLYLNGTKLIADKFSIIWNPNAPFDLNLIDFYDIFKIYLKYITKYPMDYIKHIYNYTINIWTTSSLWINEDVDVHNKVFPYKQNVDSIQSDDGIKNWNIYEFSKYPNIKFSPIREKIYVFFYNILFGINVFLFILISIILFIFSGLILIFKKNMRTSIVIFIFSTAFSASATAFIVALFTPMVLYRYIYPVIPITIISLISFITFIYDIGGFKKFLK